MRLTKALLILFLLISSTRGFSADLCSEVFILPQTDQNLVRINEQALRMGKVPDLGAKVLFPEIQYPAQTLDEVEKAGTTWKVPSPFVMVIPFFRKIVLSKIANRHVYLGSDLIYAQYQMAITRKAFFESYPESQAWIESLRKASLQTGHEWAYITMNFFFEGHSQQLVSSLFTSKSSSSIKSDDVRVALRDLGNQAQARFGMTTVQVIDFSFYHTHPGRISSPLSIEDIMATYSLRKSLHMDDTTFRVHAIGWSEKDYIYRKTFFGKPEGTFHTLKE